MTTAHFNLPPPPAGLVFPEVPQIYATAGMWIVVVLVLVFAARDTIRTRSPVAALLILGSALAYLNEPIVDVLGLVYHPRPGQWIALETYGPVPLWGLGIYIIYFGGLTLAKLRLAERGMSRREFWIGTGAFFVVNLIAELPLIQAGLYVYYGEPPLMFMGLPIYWLVVNASGPLMCVALLLRAPHLFTGWRTSLIVLLPMTTDAMGSIGAGWPAFTAINTPGASEALKYLGAFGTIAIGLLLMDGLSRLTCTKVDARAREFALPARGGLAD